MSDIDGRPLIPEVNQHQQFGILSDQNTYQVTGDWRNAYEALKAIFEPKKPQRSEGIRRYTPEELKALENKPMQDAVGDIPMTHTQVL